MTHKYTNTHTLAKLFNNIYGDEQEEDFILSRDKEFSQLQPHDDVTRSASMLQLTRDVGFSLFSRPTKQKICLYRISESIEKKGKKSIIVIVIIVALALQFTASVTNFSRISLATLSHWKVSLSFYFMKIFIHETCFYQPTVETIAHIYPTTYTHYCKYYRRDFLW